MVKWKLLRITLIGFAVVASFFTPLEPQAKPEIDYSILAIIFLFCPIGLLLVIGVQAANPKSQRVWSRPAWDLNPFNFKDPLQFFHLGAYVMLAQGVVTMFRVALSETPFYAEALVPIAMSGGVFVGVNLAILVFNSKYREST